ncbi:hypothetical protein JHK85_013177 [Glycine max]|nr:hypothetical protein JHK85_013177 [Glycine max]KAG5057839.1 hypothetical protein JHK86_012835 [Glycine max]
MESCKIAILLTIYIMAMLVFAHCCVAENVAEDVAAIPPAPMESAGVHLCASAVFLATAFVVASGLMFVKTELGSGNSSM